MGLEDILYPVLKVYEASPQWLKTAAGSAYRILPARLKWGKAYGDFCKLAAQSEKWSADQVISYQTEQVRITLEHAYAHCPFYKRQFDAAGVTPKDFQALSDLEKFPVITKQTLLEHREELVSTAFEAKRRIYITTGGSTGIPVGFYLQKGLSRPKEQAFLEAQWRRAGYQTSSRVVVIRGFVTSSRQSGKVRSYDATRDWLMLSSYHLTEDNLPHYLVEIEKFAPEFLHAYPSAALLLAHYLQKKGQKLGVPLKALLCGSEQLSHPQKKLLEETFQCRVYRWYGHSERVVLAGEGHRSAQFHFWPSYGHAELGPADDEGYREVIGTSFHNLAFPFIRYRTGDLIAPSQGGSEEFPGWTAADAIMGREQEFLVSATGRKISLTAFNMHDSIFDGLYAVQFHQMRPGEAEFRYVVGPEFQPSRLAAIESGIRRKLGDDFQVTLCEVTAVEKTARGKHKWLVSEVASA
jgi:phenylacetate-CoA ligase